MKQFLKSICIGVAVGMVMSCSIFKSSNNMNAAIEKYKYLHENLGSRLRSSGNYSSNTRD